MQDLTKRTVRIRRSPRQHWSLARSHVTCMFGGVALVAATALGCGSAPSSGELEHAGDESARGGAAEAARATPALGETTGGQAAPSSSAAEQEERSSPRGMATTDEAERSAPHDDVSEPAAGPEPSVEGEPSSTGEADTNAQPVAATPAANTESASGAGAEGDAELDLTDENALSDVTALPPREGRSPSYPAIEAASPDALAVPGGLAGLLQDGSVSQPGAPQGPQGYGVATSSQGLSSAAVSPGAPAAVQSCDRGKGRPLSFEASVESLTADLTTEKGGEHIFDFNDRDEVFLVQRASLGTLADARMYSEELPRSHVEEDDYYEFFAGSTARFQDAGTWTNQDQAPMGAPILMSKTLAPCERWESLVIIGERDGASIDSLMAVLSTAFSVTATIVDPALAPLVPAVMKLFEGAGGDGVSDFIGAVYVGVMNVSGQGLQTDLLVDFAAPTGVLAFGGDDEQTAETIRTDTGPGGNAYAIARQWHGVEVATFNHRGTNESFYRSAFAVKEVAYPSRALWYLESSEINVSEDSITGDAETDYGMYNLLSCPRQPLNVLQSLAGFVMELDDQSPAGIFAGLSEYRAVVASLGTGFVSLPMRGPFWGLECGAGAIWIDLDPLASHLIVSRPVDAAGIPLEEVRWSSFLESEL